MNNSKLSVPGQYEDESSTIYVGNIDSRLSDEEIIKHFSKYGMNTQVKDKNTKKNIRKHK